MDSFEILGEQIVREVSGAPGFDSSFLINAAGELANRGVGEYQNKQAADKAKADIQKAIAADATWAEAEVQADLASQGKDQQRILATKTLAEVAAHDANAAAAGLDANGATQRCNAANAAAKMAAENSSADTRDATKTARMRAWQKVAQKCSILASASGASIVPYGAKGMEKSSFLMVMHAGVPMWGWLAGGTTVLVGGALLIRSMRSKKKKGR